MIPAVNFTRYFLVVSFAFFFISCRKPDLVIDNLPVFNLPPAGYSLTWSDEFDGRQLDLTKWGHRLLGVRRQAVNTEEAVSMNPTNGTLLIKTFLRNDTAYTGMIGTQGRFEQKYGYFECRARVSQIAYGYWAAFWLQSPTLGMTMDPAVDGMEIDVMEYVHGYPYQVSQALHWNGYGVEQQSLTNNTLSDNRFDGSQFHVYSLEWTPDYYRFFVDSRLVWQVNGPISHMEQYMILSCEVGGKSNFLETFGSAGVTEFEVDYVRVYKKDEIEEEVPNDLVN